MYDEMSKSTANVYIELEVGFDFGVEDLSFGEEALSCRL